MKKLNIILFLLIFFTSFIIKPKYFNEVYQFIKESYKNIGVTGAIMPMSNLTSKAILDNIVNDIKTRNLDKASILEIGAGTGNMSQYIISALEKFNINFTIDLIEINPEFINLLNKKFKDHKNVKVINADIIGWETTNKYNYIISTLPFNSTDFSVWDIKSIFDKFQAISKYKGKIFWVEYAILGNIIKLFSSNYSKINHVKKHKIIDEFKNINHTKKEFIILNVPPVYVYTAENLNL